MNWQLPHICNARAGLPTLYHNRNRKSCEARTIRLRVGSTDFSARKRRGHAVLGCCPRWRAKTRRSKDYTCKKERYATPHISRVLQRLCARLINSLTSGKIKQFRPRGDDTRTTRSVPGTRGAARLATCDRVALASQAGCYAYPPPPPHTVYVG